MAVNSFRIALHRGCFKRFSVWLGLGICIMPRFWTYILFWIYQGPNYASCSEYARFLNIPGFWICQGYAMEILYGYIGSRICLNMPKCASIWLNLPEWLCFAFPHSNFLSIWTHGYLFQSLDETGWCSLKEHEAVFWKTKFDFFKEPGNTCCFLL